MSITSELKNPHSAASLWLDANFDLDTVAGGLGAQVVGSIPSAQGEISRTIRGRSWGARWSSGCARRAACNTTALLRR